MFLVTKRLRTECRPSLNTMPFIEKHLLRRKSRAFYLSRGGIAVSAKVCYAPIREMSPDWSNQVSSEEGFESLLDLGPITVRFTAFVIGELP